MVVLRSNPLVETVPNFSTGNDEEAEEIVQYFRDTEGVHFLDLHTDIDHNRSVVTAAGRASDIRRALRRAVEWTLNHLDIRDHEGVHPHMGVTDVIPFIPLSGATFRACNEHVRLLAEDLGDRLRFPAYFYDHSTRNESVVQLHSLRKYSLTTLNRKMQVDPAFRPDAGPAHIHPSGGAVAIGVRNFLIAINVDLNTDDIQPANEISREVRASSGGIEGVQAMGMKLEKQDRVMVSMNIKDVHDTSLSRVIGCVHREARKRGIDPGPSERVGLVPAAALHGENPDDWHIPDFDPDVHILERRLQKAGLLT